MSVILVSNRVARANSDEPIAGGLASALIPMVKQTGALWVGCSGHSAESGSKSDSLAKLETFGRGALVKVELPAKLYRNYYEGFANSALWPALHSRPDLIQVTNDEYAAYREVNASLARTLVRFTGPEALFWVQDYHFLVLGAELRRLQVGRPVGFFLHTPWPHRSAIEALPYHREIVSEMLAYDLIGFQTEEDQQNFADYLQSVLAMSVINGAAVSASGVTQLVTLPIGIDVDEFAARATKGAMRSDVARLRASLNGGKLVLGVDRLDYSKGLANRVRAFDRMLEFEPGLKRAVALLQVAVPSRSNIRAYRELKAELAALVGEVNARHSEVDWAPVRYINKGYAQSALAGFYRLAHVGLVTPLHDGMNLVAKEYVAAQNPFDPGVLVLSSFAGAAQQLDAALMVNPHDVDGVARQIANALAMSLEERRRRWQSMMNTLRASSLQNWHGDFLRALAAVRRTPPRLAISRPAALPRTAVGAGTQPGL